MIWAENVPTIVMLTHLIEKNKVSEFAWCGAHYCQIVCIYIARLSVISIGPRIFLTQWSTMVSLSLSWRKIPLLITKFVNLV